MTTLNESLANITTPVRAEQLVKSPKIRRAGFIAAKAEKVKRKISEQLGEAIGVVEHTPPNPDFHEQLMNELKVKIRLCSYKDQIKYLTLLPLE